MTAPTLEQLSKLPKWAQEYIAYLTIEAYGPPGPITASEMVEIWQDLQALYRTRRRKCADLFDRKLLKRMMAERMEKEP